MNDTLGPMAEKVMAFADELQKRSGVRIVFEDERLTTVFAEKILIDADLRRNKRRQVIDKMAAVAILQGFIDRKGWETINEQ
jgi:putative Holliday junction resolvase